MKSLNIVNYVYVVLKDRLSETIVSNSNQELERKKHRKKNIPPSVYSEEEGREKRTKISIIR